MNMKIKKIKNILLFSIITLLVGGGIFYWAIGGEVDPSVTDTFTDETKIFSTENLIVSGGQVKLTDVCYGIADNAQVPGCDGTCQACQGGTCGLANAGTDPGDDCTTGSTSADGCRGNNCDGTGACQVISSGEGGCPACQKCTDTDIACENYSNYTQDTASPNTCTGTHYCCVNGGCGRPTVIPSTNLWKCYVKPGWCYEGEGSGAQAVAACAEACAAAGYHGVPGSACDGGSSEVWLLCFDAPSCQEKDGTSCVGCYAPAQSWCLDRCLCWRCP